MIIASSKLDSQFEALYREDNLLHGIMCLVFWVCQNVNSQLNTDAIDTLQ